MVGGGGQAEERFDDLPGENGTAGLDGRANSGAGEHCQWKEESDWGKSPRERRSARRGDRKAAKVNRVGRKRKKSFNSCFCSSDCRHIAALNLFGYVVRV